MIIISITGLVSANYVQYTEERKLNEAIINLKTTLALARTKAMNGDIGTYPCDDFYGYQVIYNAPTTSYIMNLCCGTCAQKYQIGVYELGTNIEVRGDPFDVTFLAFAQGKEPDTESTIEIKNNFANKCNYLKISPVGMIDEGTVYGC